MDQQRKIMEKDTIELLNGGVSYGEVSNLLRIPLSEVARIEMENQTRMRFLLTGKLPESGGILISKNLDVANYDNITYYFS